MKKRFVSLLLAAVMLLSVILTVTSSAVDLPIIPLDPTYYNPAGPGDADGDGSINSKDVLCIMKYIVGRWDKVFFEQYADFNGDGKINSKDILMLMLAIVNDEV